MVVTEKWAEDVSSLPDLQHLYHCRSFPTLKLKASASLEPKISFHSETPDSDWYSKLLIFLANFNHSRDVELFSKNEEVLCPTKSLAAHLKEAGCYDFSYVVSFLLIQYSVVDIVDSLLWLSPQMDTLSFHQADSKTLKFIYEDASEKGEKRCCTCTSLTWKCWRHKLKQVKMQNFRCMEQQELRNYFFSNPDLIINEVVGPRCENGLQDDPLSGLSNLPRRSKRERLPNQKLADYICGVG
ncbi:hypothetical protein HAX54_027901 [Datura stramonium]|uniref:Uncharacterized protein n=1 Tax=Datura stramonium TaxID=4076 RepID=A0ABS8V5T8_DATST|nr:hypothetical protein [Datura stramonium]